jgi:hypothetical protein
MAIAMAMSKKDDDKCRYLQSFTNCNRCATRKSTTGLSFPFPHTMLSCASRNRSDAKPNSREQYRRLRRWILLNIERHTRNSLQL